MATPHAPEFARERLARLVTAHRDDPLGTQSACGEHTEQADDAVATTTEKASASTGQPSVPPLQAVHATHGSYAFASAPLSTGGRIALR